MHTLYTLLILTGLNAHILGSVYFKSGKTTLDSSQIQIIESIADTMQRDSLLLIDCIGYTDKSGSFKTNQIVALKRAQKVKDILVKRFKINPERIYVIAAGADTSGNTPEKSRRTDIVVHPPDAILTDFSNRVTLQPFYTPSIWLSPKGADPLYRFYKVKTARASLADIYFPHKGTIQLGSEALLIVYGPSRHHKKSQPDVTLSTGKLYTLLSREMQQAKLNIKTPAAEVSLESAKGKIGIDKNKTTLVSIFDGYAEVFAKGEKVKLKSGEGTYVKIGEKPAPPEKLPEPPVIKSSKYTLNSSDTLKIEWEPTGESYHIQIFRDTLLKKLVLDTVINQNSFRWNNISSYTMLAVRVSSISKAGLESDYSNPMFFRISEERHSSLPEIKLLNVTRIHHNLYRLRIKSKPGIMLYLQNNIIEIGNDSTAEIILRKTSPSITVKSVDKYGNFRIDTLVISAQKPSYRIGMCAGYLNGSLLSWSYEIAAGFESKVSFYKGLGAEVGIYRGILSTGNTPLYMGTFSLSYEFDLTSRLYPEFMFGYGLIYKNSRYTLQTFGAGVNIKLLHSIILLPKVLFYSTWPGNNRFKEIAVSVYFNK